MTKGWSDYLNQCAKVLKVVSTLSSVVFGMLSVVLNVQELVLFPTIWSIILWCCWLYTHTALGCRNPQESNAVYFTMYSECVGATPHWELQWIQITGRYSCHVSPSWAQSHFSCTRCLSYCDILPAVTPKPPPPPPTSTLPLPCVKIPAKWKERQMDLMVVEWYRESEVEEEL